MVCFIANCRPLSYNAEPKKKEKYKNNLLSCCERKYKGTPKCYSSEDLYGLVYYFFRDNRFLDADNLSKPVWDSLNGVLYGDDCQIVTRSVTAIDLNRHDISLLDVTNLPGDIGADIVGSVLSEDHTIYIECGIVNEKMWNFNLEETCK